MADRTWLLQAFAEVLVKGECFSATVATNILAQTSSRFTVIEGCERDDFAIGNGSGSTDGSSAEGQTIADP